MTYQVHKDYGQEARGNLLKEFRVESLERQSVNAREDLAEIASFIAAASQQLDRARNTPLKYYVEFRKEHNYATKHINYIILVFQLPDLPDADTLATRMYVWCPEDRDGRGTHNRPFLGNEKKAAIEYAQAMAAKYSATIVGNAAGLVKPPRDIIRI